MIEQFISIFTEEDIVNYDDVYELKDEWYLVSPKILSFVKNMPRKPISGGTFLGKKQNEYLVPGVDLLNLLAKSNKTKKVIVKDKAAWLFSKNKNVLAESIVRKVNNPEKGDWVLVMTESEECIGFGEIEEKGLVKNLFDIGDFLRRERPRKSKS